MNLKSNLFACAAFVGSIMVPNASSSEVPGDSMISFSSNRPDLSRSLQNPGFNCRVTAAIDCLVISDDTDCKDLNIRKDLCETIDVLIHYKFCNMHDDAIVVLQKDLTKASFYDNFSLEVNKSDMGHGVCRDTYRQERVDTCARNWIVASLKVEGWKSHSENADNYCFIYNHYMSKINKYDPPPVEPSNRPSEAFDAIDEPDNFSVELLCWLETFVGSGEYTIPCDAITLEYFQTSLQGPQDANDNPLIAVVPDYVRNVKLIVVSQNVSEENAQVLKGEVTFATDSDKYVTVGLSDNLVARAGGEPLIVSEIFPIDFSEFSGETLEIFGTLSLEGEVSQVTIDKSGSMSIEIPTIEFEWEMDSVVECEVLSSTGVSCSDYIANFDDTVDNCVVDILFKFVGTNTGTKCEVVTNIANTAFISDGSQSVSQISLSNWSDDEKMFCPDEKLSITQIVTEDICDKAEQEMLFTLTINDDEDDTNIAILTFPEKNDLTAPPVPAPNVEPMPAPIAQGVFALAVDPLVVCTMANDTTESCQEFLESADCTTRVMSDAIFSAKLDNVGDACLDIDQVVMKLGDLTRNVIDISSWTAEDKDFCPGESLNVYNPVSIDVCDYEGSEVEVKLILNGGGKFRSSFGAVQFPFANSADDETSTPPAPAPIVSNTCGFKPSQIDFKLNPHQSCPSRRLRKRRMGHKSKGKGSSQKYTSGTSIDSDIPCDCDLCKDYDSNYSSPSKRQVIIYSEKEPSEILYRSDYHNDGDIVAFNRGANMPECLVVEISASNGSEMELIQKVALHASCSNKLTDYSIGSLTVVGLSD